MTPSRADVLVVGAGAAGLVAAIFAGRTDPHRTIVAVDGAAKLGAKILVAGGGRCNVTHRAVDPGDYAGSTRPAIAKVLRRFPVPATVAFFREIGVKLVEEEETGKLFPSTSRARTVLDALLDEARNVGVRLEHPFRVGTIEAVDDGFRVAGPHGEIVAAKVVLATGGRSLPKSGSDGHGHALARALGHTTTERILPALVPLTLPPDHFVAGLKGVAVPATLEVRSGTGKRLTSFTGPVLCAHFGLTGPAVLDISRYFLDAREDDPETTLVVDWVPGVENSDLDNELRDLGRASVLGLLRGRLPERLARALCLEAGVDPGTPGHALTREGRKALVRTLLATKPAVTGSRGFGHAEVTAGGVPLRELNLGSMESRARPGLHLCGEICDVDGRIGGFNFQWAWASGHVAGISV